MMELYVFLTLSGIGYVLTRSKSNNENTYQPINKSIHYPKNVYEPNYVEKTKQKEYAYATKLHEESKQPTKNKVISSNYRDIIQEKQTNYESKLSGETIPIDNFKHNNMTPFFGGSIKQNADIDRNINSTILENFTGVGEIFNVEKQESLCFADIKDNFGNVYGNGPSYDQQYDRMKQSSSAITKLNNELPFEQQRVGPGLNKGYDVTGNDGFHPDTREYSLPKTVDALRTQSNPKETYKGRVLSGQKEIKRGLQSKVDKNRVDTYYENSSNRYLKTTGVFKKDTYRPCQILKNTNRKTSTTYSGNLYKNVGNEQTSKLQPTKKHILEQFGLRNADLKNKGKGDTDDYGKNNILVYNNERDVTSVRTYEGNLTTLVKSIVSPIQDALKPTSKEHTMQNVREFGHMQTTYPNKQTIYDPNEIARTTIKETLIHDTRSGAISGEVKSIVYDPDDVVRTTVKETLPSYDNKINFKGGTTKQTIYDPSDVTKTTIKETTENNSRDGNISSLEGGGGYETNEIDAPNTHRQFLANTEYMGSAPSKPEQHGYMTTDVNIEPTQKQFISNHEHFGLATANSDKKQMSYIDIYNATVNEVKENILKSRKPTLTNTKVMAGSDTLNVEHKKSDCEIENIRDTNNIERIYDEPPNIDFITLTQNNLDVDYVSDSANNIENRLDTDILKAFHENPYTKPLNNAV